MSHCSGGEGVGAELLARLAGELAELVVGHLLQRGADDPDGGRQLGRREVRQAGQQLAPGEVAGGAEQHDDVGVRLLQRTP